MTDLIGFLRARLDEDEQIAHDGAMRRGPDWFLREEPPPAWGDNWPDPEIIAGGKPIVCCDEEQGGYLVAEHVARHDPARVLAEVTAKRALLDAMIGPALSTAVAGTCDAGLATARLLALPFSDHPDYDESWRP